MIFCVEFYQILPEYQKAQCQSQSGIEKLEEAGETLQGLYSPNDLLFYQSMIQLNPDTQKSTLDIQQERLATQEEEIKPRLKTSKVEAQSSKPETIVDLRKRLHDRIAALEQKRVGKSSIPAEAEAGSSSSKRRADLIDQRKAKKLKSKQKAQQEKMSLGAVKQNQLVASNDGAKLLANGHMVKDIQEEFDFGAIEIEGLKTKKQKADLKAALAKVEKQEQKLKGLEERDTEKVRSLPNY